MEVKYHGLKHTKDGKLLGHKYEYNGTIVYVYLPEESSGSCDATVYYPGMKGYNQGREYTSIDAYYRNGNPNTAFIAVSESEGGTQTKNINAILKYLKGQGLNLNVNDFSGASLGGGPALKRFTDYLTKNSNPPSNCTLTLYDPYGGFPRDWPRQGQYARRDRKNADGTYNDYNPALMKAMKENGSSVRIFTPNGRAKDFIGTQFLNSLARNGIPTALIGTYSGHNTIRIDSLGDGWNAYYDGTIDITQIKNAGKYKVYIPTVNASGKVTWTPYTLSDIQNAYVNPSSSSPEFLAALNYLESTKTTIDFDYLSEISTIKTVASNLFGLASAPSISYTSSSSLLPAENELLAAIYNVCRSAGDTLEKEVNMITNASEEYLALEHNLTKLTEELNSNLQALNTPIKLPDNIGTNQESTVPETNPTSQTNSQPVNQTLPTEPATQTPTNPQPDTNPTPAIPTPPTSTVEQTPQTQVPASPVSPATPTSTVEQTPQTQVPASPVSPATPTSPSSPGTSYQKPKITQPSITISEAFESISKDKLIAKVKELINMKDEELDKLSKEEIIEKLKVIISSEKDKLNDLSATKVISTLEEIVKLEKDKLSSISKTELLLKLKDAITIIKKENK